MTADDEHVDLRTELQRITDGAGVDQVSAIQRLQDGTGHSISSVRHGSDGQHGYNCFMYALGIEVLPEWLVALAHQYDEAFPNSQFVAWLLATTLREIAATDVQGGDIVMYFDDRGQPKHAGVARNGMVVSKWGTGHVWAHGVFEVPSSYGIAIRYYRRIEPSQALALFIAFVEEKLGN